MYRRSRYCWVWVCVAGVSVAAVAHAGTGRQGMPPDLAGYTMSVPDEPVPDKPLHAYVTDPKLKTPDGAPNPCARWCDRRLALAVKGQLAKAWPRHNRREAPQLLHWAVWGYLSPDSQFKGDARLIPLMRDWIDAQVKQLNTEPSDPKKRARWRKGSLGTWGFHNYTAPLMDLEANPDLAEQVGRDRVKRWRDLVVANVRYHTTQQRWNDLMGRADTYINIITHPMAVYTHGWVLTGDRKLLWMATHIVRVLARDQAPGGTFPYRKLGGAHRESEVMYYHAINIRGLYMHWWATGSKLAERVFRKAVGYYPSRMFPPYYYTDNAAIWWKDQWRTFWPNHVAMTAAVSGDGENATIATVMARDNVSTDRFDLVLGAHAYQQMALRGVTCTPRADRYVRADDDVWGLRGRFGHFGFNFSGNSYSHTLAGAIATSKDDKQHSALHLARPCVRVAPLETSTVNANFCTLGKFAPDVSRVIGPDFGAAAMAYVPFQAATTWRPVHKSAPWQFEQLWLYTPGGMVGLMTSQTTLDMPARELCHQFRFIVPRKMKLAVRGADEYVAGQLWMRVHATDLPERIVERARRYALHKAGPLPDWQVCLSDTKRSPQEAAIAARGKKEAMARLLLPAMRPYAKGYRKFSLVEIGPEGSRGATKAKLLSSAGVLAFRVTAPDKRYYVAAVHYADQDKPLTYELALPGVQSVRLHRSWLADGKQPEAVAVESGRVRVELPVRGVVVAVW